MNTDHNFHGEDGRMDGTGLRYEIEGEILAQLVQEGHRVLGGHGKSNSQKTSIAFLLLLCGRFLGLLCRWCFRVHLRLLLLVLRQGSHII